MPNDVVQRLAFDGVPPRTIVVGNPVSRRVAEFLAAAAALGLRACAVSYPDVLRGGLPFEPAAGDVVRLESPGECPQTTRSILQAGIEPLESAGRMPLSRAEIERRTCDRGEMLYPLQWFLGFDAILRRCEALLAPRAVRWMTSPATIARAFDKLGCLQSWESAGLPTPPRYDGVSSYDELRQTVRDRHARLFVKLRYGYSAMGAAALEWRGPLVRAITTVEVVRDAGGVRLFVSKRPRTLRDESEVAWLIDRLGREEIVVERWLPKARRHGRPFDIRAVVIGGSVRHVVGRANDSPFTNLNLDATRIARREIVRTLGRGWPRLTMLCRRAAAAFPDAASLGIDVLVRPGGRGFTLLEANAFGDYLPGLKHALMSTHEAALRWFLRPRRAAA